LRRIATAALSRVSLPVLSRLNAELAHDLALGGLALLRPLWQVPPAPAGLALRVMGLSFAHPLGLAAGFDKNADCIDSLGALGFGHIEVGTVTPRPQPGNPKPRMFRFRAEQALVNRMGFNNKGVDHLVGRLERSRYGGVRGVSIGKNADTPIERAEQDYLVCLRKVYPHADYVAVNVSSPNTARLRELQDREGLRRIVGPLLQERVRLETQYGRRVPILVKLAPNLDDAQLAAIAGELLELRVDGVIATNTSNDLRDFAARLPANQQGGLSGAPLHRLSVSVIAKLRGLLGADFPIIGVGGIVDVATALETLDAGANLIQIYTGFALQGEALVRKILNQLAERCHDRPDAG
jgi:dihydroorotate dehydrogenase